VNILTENDSFTLSNRDGGVECPPFQVIGGLAASLEKGFKIFDPLLEKQIFIFLFDEERDFALPNE
jgi:hypothetical protein